MPLPLVPRGRSRPVVLRSQTALTVILFGFNSCLPASASRPVALMVRSTWIAVPSWTSPKGARPRGMTSFDLCWLRI